ncbi:polysaccharide pyruvyl transferase family protein [Halalkalicoccus jeotgali]|uniref:polysaccharide pyruvyl transferase family protein n=1 Tax=Halalkalicoccus jeotgali TaxID=413810 RepID=UPI0009D98ACF|nr:polysaccharide pyruvyl transferase family protein [Halalkalicoccus jeotgali]
MVRIGILTFSNNENRGALLQAYCVKQLLEQEIEGSTVSVVDYRTKSKERSRRFNIFAKHPKKLPTLLNRIQDFRICENFAQNTLFEDTDQLITNDHGEAVSWLEEKNYDLIITGSDEVWKIRSKREGIHKYTRPNRPFPNLYFLDPSLSATTASYAASSNTTIPDRLNKYERKTMERHISAIDFVSVRDHHTKELLSDFGIKNVRKVPDPTLTVDIPIRSNSSRILKKNGIDVDKPVLNVHSEEHPAIRRACKYYKNKGYQIISTRSSPYADINMMGKVDPFEYYSLYNLCDLVLTTSLHSTIFSLKNGTPFVTIDTNEIYRDIESKTHSLLRDFELLERHVPVSSHSRLLQEDQLEKYEMGLDQDHVKSKINKMRKDGRKYIQSIGQNINQRN